MQVEQARGAVLLNEMVKAAGSIDVATLSPLARTSSVIMRPKPDMAPMMSQTLGCDAMVLASCKEIQ